ncbi:TPA: transcriptional regulator [Candidatus Sumerlaeota bacterium]|jgi:Rrf2 family protein|nr:transcriptional regulator [Candidatus Sumerlaeota bacterium]
MFSMKTKYAIKALIRLAHKRHNGPVLIADLSVEEGIPKKFLENILLSLKNEGMLASRKGKGGGYALLRRPEDIRIAQVVQLFDGPLAVPSCVKMSMVRSCNACGESPQCGLRLVMAELKESISGCLDRLTLLDLVLESEEPVFDPVI